MIGKESVDTSGLEEIDPEQAGKDEGDIQNSILNNPRQLLLEDLLLLGEEVKVGPHDERIDILALDQDLNPVITEIKNRALKRKDIKQAMKYAPYIAERDDLEDLYQGDSREFQAKLGLDDSSPSYDNNLRTTLDEFSEKDSLGDEQRIFLVGTGIQQTAGDMANWLQDQGIPLKVINLTGYEDPRTDEIILTADNIDLDKVDLRARKEWEQSVESAKNYHRETRVSEKTKDLLDNILSEIEDRAIFTDPDWQQKNYISFSEDDTIRIKVRPRKTKVNIWFLPTDIDEHEQDELMQNVSRSLQISFNTEKDRIEVELSPDDAEAIEPLIDFACEEIF